MLMIFQYSYRADWKPNGTRRLFGDRILLMNTSSKVQAKGPTLKYTVLRPYPKILTLARSFKRAITGENYLLAVEQDFGVRKYHVSVDSFQQSLKQAQWRYNCLAPVVRCLYVQLLDPSPLRGTSVQMYVSHLEVMLGDLKQLLLQEALYLIIQALKGYETLLENYRKVSVNDHTIGVSSNGQCLVWINRFLEQSHCEDKSMTSSLQIIETILKLVKDRSQPVCRKFLTKVEEVISTKRPNFREALDIIRCFASKNGVKVPNNLKYLLHQHRIKESFNQLQSLKASMRNIESLHEKNNEIFISIKSPKFLKHTLRKENERPVSKDIALLSAPNQFKKLRKYSAAEPNSACQLRNTVEVPEPIITSFSFNPNNSSKSWSWKGSEKHSGQIKTVSKFKDLNLKQNKSLSSTADTRARRGSEDVCARRLLNPNHDTSMKNLKRCSGISENTRAGNSCFNQSVISHESDSSVEVETVKKIAIKCSIAEHQKNIESRLTSIPILQYSNQNSLPMSPLNSLDPTFHCIPDVIGDDHIKQEVIKTNNWTKTFKNLIGNTEANLNVSISDGQGEVSSSYLDDIKLQKLDTLSRQMVQSLEPLSSEREVVQIRDSFNY